MDHFCMFIKITKSYLLNWVMVVTLDLLFDAAYFKIFKVYLLDELIC